MMKDPINVTVPMALTTKEAEDMKADTSKGKYDKAKDLYYFYDLTYDVDNEKLQTPPLIRWIRELVILSANRIGDGIVYRIRYLSDEKEKETNKIRAMERAVMNRPFPY